MKALIWTISDMREKNTGRIFFFKQPNKYAIFEPEDEWGKWMEKQHTRHTLQPIAVEKDLFVLNKYAFQNSGEFC